MNQGERPGRVIAHAGAAAALDQALEKYGAAIRFVALLGLCAAYLQGGLTKLAGFDGAVAEAQHFNLPFAPIAAAATIVTELAGSALVLTGFYRWLGALWLAGFTLAATLIAHRFWEMVPPERFFSTNAFFEHMGLIGGFVLVAWLDLREKRQAHSGVGLATSP